MIAMVPSPRRLGSGGDCIPRQGAARIFEGVPEAMLLLLPDGSAYRVLATSTPIVIDGKVVAGLSV